MYTWVKRANASGKVEMQEVVDSYNELAYEDAEVHQYVPYYRLERNTDSWQMVAYVDYAVEGFEDIYTHGERRYAIGFVRCGICGHIRELADGQGEFCTTCEADWEKGELFCRAKALYNEFKENYTFMTKPEARIFHARLTKLSKKIDKEKDHQALMYLDVIATRIGMEIW